MSARRRAIPAPDVDPGPAPLSAGARVAHVLLELAADPSAAPGHDVRRRPLNAAELAAAWAWYRAAIPARPGRAVVSVTQPAVLRVTWTFRNDPARPGTGPLGDRASWHAAAPALVEHAGVVAGVLAQRGYLLDPCEVACAVAAKRCGGTPGVRVYLRTLVDAEDAGLEARWPDDAPLGVVRPIDRHGGAVVSAADLGERPIGAGRLETPAPPPEKRR